MGEEDWADLTSFGAHKTPRFSAALKPSVSGVQMAAAVPVCHGGLSATIALFSMTSVELSKEVEDFQDCYLHILSHSIMQEMRNEQTSQKQMSE